MGKFDQKKKKGFTLLELILALLLFTIGFLAIAQAFNVGIFAASELEKIEVALHIAQAKMEEVKNTEFEDLVDVNPTSDPNFPGFLVSVNEEEVEKDNLSQVDVTVAWNVKGSQSSITLTTLVANY